MIALLPGEDAHFIDMETAILWGGMPPSAFYALPDRDRALMTAHFRERRLRTGLLNKVQAKMAEKSAKSKATAPEGNCFEAYRDFGL